MDLYVSTDSEGIEHASSGPISWNVPPDSAVTKAGSGPSLVLRQPIALLEVLEEVIYKADPLVEVKLRIDGTVCVDSAQLTKRMPWNSEMATRFALDCAEHALSDAPDMVLPDGTPLKQVITDARQMLDDVELDSDHRLGYFARLSALRRLRRNRDEIADLSLGQMLEDEIKDLDALDDPAYATIIPVTDAVLAAIEALRHHVLPRFYESVSERIEEHEEATNLEREHPSGVPVPAQTTPFGPIMFGGGVSVPRYEPAGISAREAARHARIAVRDRHGPKEEIDEQLWQATRLEDLLKDGT